MEDKQVKLTAKTRQELTYAMVIKTFELDAQGWAVVAAHRTEYRDWLGRNRWKVVLLCKPKVAKHE